MCTSSGRSARSKSGKRIGRPPKVGPDEKRVLIEIIAEDRHATIRHIAAQLAERTGITIHPITLGKIMKRLDIRRVRQNRHVSVKPETPRYGYQARHRAPDASAGYPSSLTDAEWAEVCDLFDPPGQPGRPPRHDRRAVLDGCLYVLRTGCAWRLLPNDFPHWDNVYKTFRRWHQAGLFERLHDRLSIYWRRQMGRQRSPQAAVIDSQSNRHSPQGGEAGYDANKKILGRKRHIVTDTLGIVLAVTVSAASVADRSALAPTVGTVLAKHPHIETLYADNGYAGQAADNLSSEHAVDVAIMPSTGTAWTGPQAELFGPAPTPPGGGLYRRWVVERTHAWHERFRRLIIHHDRLAEVGEAWTWLANARLLLSRLFR